MSALVSQGVPAEFHKGDKFSIFYILSDATLNGDFGNIEPGSPIPITDGQVKMYMTPIGSDIPMITKTATIHPTIVGRVDFDFAPADTSDLQGTTSFNVDIHLVELSGAPRTFDAPDIRILETHNIED